MGGSGGRCVQPSFDLYTGLYMAVAHGTAVDMLPTYLRKAYHCPLGGTSLGQYSLHSCGGLSARVAMPVHGPLLEALQISCLEVVLESSLAWGGRWWER